MAEISKADIDKMNRAVHDLNRSVKQMADNLNKMVDLMNRKMRYEMVIHNNYGDDSARGVSEAGQASESQTS